MLIGFAALVIEVLACGFLLQSDASNYDQSGAAVILLIINTILVCFLLYRQTENKRINMALLGSFVLRICVLLWDVYARDVFILPNSEGDAVYYHIDGIRYAFLYYKDKVDTNKYAYWVGKLYRIIGSQKVTVQFIHVFLAICSICLIYKMLKMFDVRTKIIETTIFIICFLPNNLMVTTFFLQESVIAFVLISSLYLYTKWWYTGKIPYFIVAVVISILISRLHSGGLVCAAGFLLAIFLIKGKEKAISLSAWRIVLIVLAGLLMLVLLNEFGGGNINKIGEEGVTVESITYESEVRNDGGGAYTVGFDGLTGWTGVIVNTPIRAIYFVLSPMPWEWRGLSDIFAFFGSAAFYLWTIFVSIKAARSTKIYKDVDSIKAYMLVLVIVLAVASVMFGWGVSNSGSALRHREKFTFIFVMLFGIAKEISARAEDKKNGQEDIRYSSCL